MLRVTCLTASCNFTVRKKNPAVLCLALLTDGIRAICVAIGDFVLYAGGDYALHLNIMLLVQVMAYVSCTFAHRYSGALDMRTRIRPADWCARGSDIASGWDLCRRLESQSSRTVSLTLSSRQEQTCL